VHGLLSGCTLEGGCQSTCLVIARFQVRCPVGAVVSLGKKLYSHCLSHPAVKPGKYCIIRAQLKSNFIADIVIPVKMSKNQKNRETLIARAVR